MIGSLNRIGFALRGAALFLLIATSAFAQGVAPGGPIGNSTGIGSGLGGVTNGTGPSYPNGSSPSPQPTYSPPPPGGGGLPSASMPSTSTPSSSYVPSGRGYETHMRKPSTVPMTLPGSPAATVAFLRGCWRTDVFQYEQHSGITTWCFNDRGAGRVLYSRIDQPNYACNAEADARYAAGVLLFHSLASTCSDGRALPLGDLDCRQNGEVVHCSGSLPAQGPGETWSVGLYRVQR